MAQQNPEDCVLVEEVVRQEAEKHQADCHYWNLPLGYCMAPVCRRLPPRVLELSLAQPPQPERCHSLHWPQPTIGVSAYNCYLCLRHHHLHTLVQRVPFPFGPRPCELLNVPFGPRPPEQNVLFL